MTDEHLEQEIRDAIDPDGATVRRLVDASLTASARRNTLRWYVLGAAGVAILIAAVTTLLPTNTVPGPVPQVRVTNVDDTIVVTQADGSVWLIGRGAQSQARIAPGIIVVHNPGDDR